MLPELLRKWFGLSEPICLSCEILSRQLEKSERERIDLLNRLFEKGKPDPVPQTKEEEPTAITPQFVPWRVRQQMLEQEDRVKARLMKDKAREIDELEKELGVSK